MVTGIFIFLALFQRILIASLEVLITNVLKQFLYIGSFSMSWLKFEISQDCTNFDCDNKQICNKFDSTD